jgi:hypothetical protein
MNHKNNYKENHMNSTANICYNCGGEFRELRDRMVCQSCGTYKPKEISSEEAALLYSAFQKLRLAEFYEAEQEFDDIICRYPGNAQAYWGRLLSRYGIKYEEDHDGKRIPTCYASSIESILESSDYVKAVEYADDDNREVFGGDFLSYAMSLTAAASDARMAGCTLAAMSNSGSGNQGITVTMPVIAYSITYGTDDEKLARALVLSHLIAIHIKGYLGKLSALCGCVIASTGASCGLVYLRGGDYEQICAAIKNMIGNITGMVCDGAKVGCAMKVASGVSSALQSAVLAREGICISEHDGIIEKDIEKTIQNLGKIGSVGMQHTDNMILDIMVCK